MSGFLSRLGSCQGREKKERERKSYAAPARSRSAAAEKSEICFIGTWRPVARRASVTEVKFERQKVSALLCSAYVFTVAALLASDESGGSDVIMLD